ncbi:helix-turn-helix domain-containing protein [Listeria aquatica]|uniref:helix-turn-helix domain-containing protein n=1 Tax=Listeria aquatica TaxID=1494960 RepID=UPI0004B85B02|nr:helix-turn-helix domain-containing protein [Listeria aquatica]
MNIYQFLDHSEQQKTYLLRFLESHHAEYLPSQKIMDFLSISNFKLQRLIDEINEDFQEHPETTKLQIKIENKHFIHCPNLTEKDISYLKLAYLEKSYLFLLLQELMIQPTSIYSFSDNFYISKTKAYNVQQELIQILAAFNLTIKGGKLVGDEIIIRNLLYNIYYNFYHGIKEPLIEHMDDRAKQYFSKLKTELSSNLPVTQRLKIFFLPICEFFPNPSRRNLS